MTQFKSPLRLKVQLFCGDEGAIGPGKAALLEAIAQEGSISGAGRRMEMSYRRAWLLVDEMNRCWHGPLVQTRIGGGKDRGAGLTPLGREVLDRFRRMEAHLRAEAAEEVAALKGLMLDAPLEAASHVR